MKICVFCGSSKGNSVNFNRTAISLAETLSREGIELVYGGGTVGLMGTLANTMLEHGGRVTGVITQHLFDSEIAHTGLTELHVVDGMDERKKMMLDLSDGVLALPGGVGTLEELFLAWTWGQLGLHRKPCGILDVDAFYKPLIQQIRQMVSTGLMDQQYQDMLIVRENAKDIVDAFRSYRPPKPKWAKDNTGGIESVGWICIKAGRILVTRTKGRDAFYLPGGKGNVGESHEETLCREANEELSVAILKASVAPAGVFTGVAHGMAPNTKLHMTCYTADFTGDLHPNAEIAEYAWFSSRDKPRCAPVAQSVLECMYSRGFID